MAQPTEWWNQTSKVFAPGSPGYQPSVSTNNLAADKILNSQLSNKAPSVVAPAASSTVPQGNGGLGLQGIADAAAARAKTLRVAKAPTQTLSGATGADTIVHSPAYATGASGTQMTAVQAAQAKARGQAAGASGSTGTNASGTSTTAPADTSVNQAQMRDTVLQGIMDLAMGKSAVQRSIANQAVQQQGAAGTAAIGALKQEQAQAGITGAGAMTGLQVASRDQGSQMSKLEGTLATGAQQEAQTAMGTILGATQGAKTPDEVTYDSLQSQFDQFMHTGQTAQAQAVFKQMQDPKYNQYGGGTTLTVPDWSSAGSTGMSVDNAIRSLQTGGFLKPFEDASGNLSATAKTELSSAVRAGLTQGAFSVDSSGNVTVADPTKMELPWNNPNYYSEYHDWNGNEIAAGSQMDPNGVVNIPNTKNPMKNSDGSNVTNAQVSAAWAKISNKESYMNTDGSVNTDAVLHAGSTANAGNMPATWPSEHNASSFTLPGGKTLQQGVRLFGTGGQTLSTEQIQAALPSVWYQLDQMYGSGKAGGTALEAGAVVNLLATHAFSIDPTTDPTTNQITNLNSDLSKVATSPTGLSGYTNAMKGVTDMGFSRPASWGGGSWWSSQQDAQINSIIASKDIITYGGKSYIITGIPSAPGGYYSSARPALQVTQVDANGNPTNTTGILRWDYSGQAQPTDAGVTFTAGSND